MYNNGAKLYNGNIGAMVTTITKPDTREVLPLGNAYQYDQLNRLSTSKSFGNLNLSNNSWGNTGTYDNKYYNAFNYDANGNILNQIRHDSTGNKIDDLIYNYEKNFAGRLLRNRLYQVNDVVNDATYADDIDDMGVFDNNVNSINIANNYSYDGEGRLVKDRQEEIDTIIWRVDGKVKEIQRTSGSTMKNLVFDYDPMGRRTAKKIYSSSNVFEKAVYYSLDAHGNVMTTYEMNIDTANTALDFYQTEKFIYGSSRLGMLKDSVNVLGSAYGNTDTSNFVHTLGNKRYELSNHLGNVLTVISDKPIPHNNGGTVDYFMADIKSAQDYSPFGVTLSGRDFNSSESRYGFNSMEKDDEVKGRGNSYDFGARMYDSRLGRWLSIDAYFKEYVPISPYAFAINCPIKLKDSDGNVIVDEKGNPVTVTATKNKDGSYDASFTFAENTSESVKENFRENGGRFITTAIQIQTGRDQIEKAIKSKDNIEIVIDKVNEKHSKDGGLILGETELKQLKSSFQDGKSIVDESQDIRITIYEKAIINHQESKDVKYSQKGLSLDEGIATTGSHEVEHATNSIDRNLLIESTEISDKQHKVAKKVGDKAASEFRNKK